MNLRQQRIIDEYMAQERERRRQRSGRWIPFALMVLPVAMVLVYLIVKTFWG